MFDLINSAQAVSLPTIGGGQDLPAFISSVYSFALTVVGIAVFVQIVRAGFLYLTAAGDISKASGAKSMMTNAVIGAILLFAAYMILFTINPDLVRNTFNFSIPRGDTVQEQRDRLESNPTDGSAALYGVPGRERSSGRLVPFAHAQAGIYFFTIKVVDAVGDFFEQDYSMEVLPKFAKTSNKEQLGSKFYANPRIVRAQEHADLTIVTPFVQDAVIDVPYFAEVEATGGQPPYVYSISEGSLPQGLALAATLHLPWSVINSHAGGHTDTSGGGGGTAGGGGGHSGGCGADCNLCDGDVNACNFDFPRCYVNYQTRDCALYSTINNTGSFEPCREDVFCEDPQTGERLPDPSPLPGGGYQTCEAIGANQRVECYYSWQDPAEIECDGLYRRERESCLADIQDGGDLPSCNDAQPGQACRTSDNATHCKYSDQQDAFYCGAAWSNLGTGYCLPGQTTNCYPAPDCSNPQTVGQRAACAGLTPP